MAKLNNISGYSHRAVAVESFQNLIVSCLSPEPICQQKNHSNFSLPLQILYDVCCSTPFVLILQRAKPGAPVSSCSRSGTFGFLRLGSYWGWTNSEIFHYDANLGMIVFFCLFKVFCNYQAQMSNLRKFYLSFI